MRDYPRADVLFESICQNFSRIEDQRREENPKGVHTFLSLGIIPGDSQMRNVLDVIPSQMLPYSFRKVFHVA